MDGNSSKHVIALLEEKLREIDEALSNLKTDSV